MPLKQDPTEESPSQEPGSDEDILAVARRRFDLAVDADKDQRVLELDDLAFRSGDQWPEDIKALRKKENRPALTFNRLPQYVHQVTNDLRQNRPSINVNPVDDEADVETAKILKGLIRHIENNSNADVAYDTAGDGAATKGRGYFRILTEYCDPNSFNQEIVIKRIRNSHRVYLDPHHQEPDGSDANWGFIFEDMAIDDYKAEFPKSQAVGAESWRAAGDNASGWVTEKSVRVAEYFYKTFRPATIYLLSDGRTVELKDGEVLPEGITVVQDRETTLPAIKWIKTNGMEILEKTDWPGLWIPIIPVIGSEIEINGKVTYEGVIRHAKDPQRQYNYMNTAATEMIALAPKAPFIGYEGQFEGHEHKWENANNKTYPYLEVKAKMLGGAAAPLPQRQVYEPPIQAISQMTMQAAEDMKTTTGIYDASMGARSNENSGIAIQRRNQQAQTNNFHYADNLSRSLRHGGRIILDLIPHIYDAARRQRIVSEDGTPEMVDINQDIDGKESYWLTKGKYDVTVSTGPSYQTKRQEAAAAMLELSKTSPKFMDVAPDLIVRELDIPGAQEIAERLKATVPPGLIKDKKDQAPLPPEVQAQLAQQTQMIEQLTQSLHEATNPMELKRMELESRERIENLKIQANIEIELAKMGSAEGMALLKAEIGQISERMALLNQDAPIESDQNPTAGNPAAQPEMNQPDAGPAAWQEE